MTDVRFSLTVTSWDDETKTGWNQSDSSCGDFVGSSWGVREKPKTRARCRPVPAVSPAESDMSRARAC
jgi:hypothetical protein